MSDPKLPNDPAPHEGEQGPTAPDNDAQFSRPAPGSDPDAQAFSAPGSDAEAPLQGQQSPYNSSVRPSDGAENADGGAPGQPAGPGQFSQQPGQQQYFAGQHGGGQPYGGSQYGAPQPPQYGHAPAGPPPMTPLDERNAGAWGHFAGLSTIVTGGFGGWLGPLIVFLIYKDRSAFARQEAKEALNFGIFMTILALSIVVLGTILTIVSFGLLGFVPALYWVPGLLQVIFAIIGGIRVLNGGSYRYPFNWRLLR